MTAHIPAWRRLGLQLKRPDPGADIDADRRPDGTVAKQPKTLASSSDHNLDGNSSIHPRFETAFRGNSLQSPPALPTPVSQPLRKKQKTVSFDTTIALSPSRRADNSSEISVVASEHPAGRNLSDAPSKLAGDQGRGKIKKKQAKDARLGNSSGADGSTPFESPRSSRTYVDYLHRFANDKATWKFNKNMQTQLLSSLFIPHRIPPEYDSALCSYIEGLQGEAARLRVVEDAERILTTGIVIEQSENSSPSQLKRQDNDTAIDDDNMPPKAAEGDIRSSTQPEPVSQPGVSGNAEDDNTESNDTQNGHAGNNISENKIIEENNVENRTESKAEDTKTETANAEAVNRAKLLLEVLGVRQPISEPGFGPESDATVSQLNRTEQSDATVPAGDEEKGEEGQPEEVGEQKRSRTRKRTRNRKRRPRGRAAPNDGAGGDTVTQARAEEDGSSGESE